MSFLSNMVDSFVTQNNNQGDPSLNSANTAENPYVSTLGSLATAAVTAGLNQLTGENVAAAVNNQSTTGTPAGTAKPATITPATATPAQSKERTMLVIAGCLAAVLLWFLMFKK